MNVEHMDLTDSPRPGQDEGVPSQREVLEELFQLLEDYAPTWYTEQHHNRIVAALLGKRA